MAPLRKALNFFPVLDQLFYTLMDEGEAILLAAP